MSSVGASCAHVYVMKKRLEERLKAKEAERGSKGGSAVAAVEETSTDRPVVGKGTNKVHPNGGFSTSGLEKHRGTDLSSNGTSTN